MREPVRDVGGNVNGLADYRFASTFVVRTPLLPYDDFVGWPTGEAPSAYSTDEQLDDHRRRLQQDLRERLDRPDVRGALQLGAPSFYASSAAWLAHRSAYPDPKLERAATRYLSRMCARPSPFGAFAGVSIGTLARRSDVNLAARSEYRVHHRIAVGLALHLHERLESDDEIRARLRWRVNPSLHRSGTEVRWYAHRTRDGQRAYAERRAAADDTLMAVIDRGEVAATLAELTEHYAARWNVDRREAHDYLDDLIEQQILTSELRAPLVGPDAGGPFVDQLARLGAPATLTRVLRAATESLSAPARVVDGLPQAVRALGEVDASLDPRWTLHTDLTKPTVRATLSTSVLGRIKRGLSVLHRLAPAPVSTTLDAFRDALAERFGHQDVPLSTAVDPDLGVGFPVGGQPSLPPLLRGLVAHECGRPVGSPSGANRHSERTWTGRDAWLLRRLERNAGSEALELTADDLDDLPPSAPSLPDGLLVQVQLESLASGDEPRPWIDHAVGPTAARLLARFSSAAAEIEDLLTAEAELERALHPDTIFAEVVHLPPRVNGELLRRPATRAFEIDCLGTSGSSATQIRLSDLMLRVEAGRVVLWSRELAREVVPRLSSAHEHRIARNLPVYRLLGALQGQGTVPALRWDWGALEDARFLPRVTFGGAVLSPARWALHASDLERLHAGTSRDAFRVVARWRAERGWPRVVGVLDGETVLPLDLDNVLSVDAFVASTRRERSVRLRELPQTPSALFVRGAEGRFVGEVHLALHRRSADAVAQPPRLSRPQVDSAVRTLPPGSAWSCAELACGAHHIDDVLLDALAPALDSLRDQIDFHWLFVRERTPQWNVRLRFHVPLREHRSILRDCIDDMAAGLLTRGVVRAHAWTTYERELERYGGPVGLALSERMFFADSEACLDVLAALVDAPSTERWLRVAQGVDMMLADLGIDLHGKLAVTRRMRDALASELRCDPGRVAATYRRERTNLEAVLLSPETAPDRVTAALRRRSEAFRTIGSALCAAGDNAQLWSEPTSLACSYAHQHANRMFESYGRAQEYLVHDFLSRTYRSALARAGRSEEARQ